MGGFRGKVRFGKHCLTKSMIRSTLMLLIGVWRSSENYAAIYRYNVVAAVRGIASA